MKPQDPALVESRRVVVVDDDQTMRRLVQMAMEDLDVDLVMCASAQEALRTLAQAPARLVITDLMMPGMSGFDLLEQLVARPDLRAGARLVVFSAGLHAGAQARLASMPIWRQLSKPVSVLDLIDCVEEALAPAAVPAAIPAAVPAAKDPPRAGTGSMPVGETAPDRLSAGEQSVVETQFAGNLALYRAFKQECQRQFAADVDEVESALQQLDAVRLHRRAHSLRGVLDTLGQPSAAEAARGLELAAALGDWSGCLPHWGQLRRALLELIRPSTT